MKKKLEILNEGAVDLFFLFLFLKRLVTPFKNWDAFKLGIIDQEGVIIKPKKERTPEENKSLTKFDLLVLKLKRLLGKIPGGKSKLASYAAALWFLKEGQNIDPNNDNLIAESYQKFYESIQNHPIYLKEVREVMYLIERDFTDKNITKSVAKKVGDKLGIDFTKIDIDEFIAGMKVELEHDKKVDPKLDVIDSLTDVGKIALAHLKENPRYYTELKKSGIEEEVPVNNIGSGHIATFDPVLTKKKRKRLRDFIE